MRRSRYAVLILVAALMLLPGASQAASCTWTGAVSSSWTTAANWDCGSVPGPGDSALIGSGANVVLNSGSLAVGTLTLSGNLTVDAPGSLTVQTQFTETSSGNLLGTGTVTIDSLGNWSGGTMQGTGSTVVGATATLTMSGASQRYLMERTLQNFGTITWTTTSTLSMINSAKLFNESGALIDVQSTSVTGITQHCCSFPVTIRNDGTLRKSAGSASFFIDIPSSFTNNGLVDIEAGSFNPSGGSTNNGVLNADAGGIIEFTAATHQLANASQITGAGTIRLNGGTLNTAGTSSLSNLAFSAGQILGTGNLRLTGTATWTGGEMHDAGTTTVTSGSTLTLTGASTRFLETRTLRIQGMFVFGNTAQLSIWGSGSFLNDAGGLVDIQGSGQIYQHCCSFPVTITNAGTWRKSGTGTFATMPVTNDGLFDLRRGLLDVTGAFTQSASGTLSFELAGVTAGTDHAQLRVPGATANLAGTLTAVTSAFSPSSGQFFTVLTYGSRSGDFATKNLSLGGGKYLQDVFSASDLRLVTRVSGTFDLSSATYAVAENGASLTVTVNRSGGTDGAVTVDYATTPGTATAGSDYTAASGTLSFAGGETSKTFPVSIADDAIDEVDETFQITLSNPGGGAILGTTTTATATINDDDPAPSVTFTAASQSSASESGTMTITAQLSNASASNVSVPFTASGTAAGGDYTIDPSPLVINAGSLSGTITITITADTTDEADETVIVTMGTPVNATPGATTVHTATITDDDAAPSVTFTAASQSSANESGTMTITAQLSNASSSNVSVPFTTSGTAGGGDSTIDPSPLAISAGSLSGTITITITADTTDEPDETVIVTMGTPVNATPGATTAHTATITDDDAAPSVTFTAASQSSASESGTMTVTAQLSNPSASNVSVPFTPSGTAGGGDYTIDPSPLVIPAGSLTGIVTITITITSDTTDEADETVIVTMGTPVNATPGATTAHTATITDDDGVPSVTFTTAAQSSANESGTMTITAQLSNPTASNVSVPFTTSGTAGGGSDYTIDPSPLVIPAGSLSGTITITITSDTTDEAGETVIVTMGTPVNATPGATTVHTATITDDDGVPSVTFTTAAQSSANESGTMTITAQLSNPSASNVSVPFTTSGTAGGGDYAIDPSPLVIPAGSLSGTINITITADTTDEAGETVIVTMGTPVNATQGATPAHTATITDDDAQPLLSFTGASQSSAGESGSMTVTLQLSAQSGLDVTAPFTLSGTAGSGDYTITSSPILFPAGNLTTSLTINVTSDTIDESDETVVVTLGTPTNATLTSPSTHTAMIIDDDQTSLPAVSFASASQISAGETGTMTATVQLSSVSSLETSIPFAIHSNSTATASDFTISASPLVIPAGQTSGSIVITIKVDAIDEPDESVVVTLQPPLNATLGSTTTHTAEINDDDAPPTISFELAAQARTNESGPVSVLVKLSSPSGFPVRVPFSLNTASTASSTDYTLHSMNPIIIPPGNTGHRIGIDIIADTVYEGPETVILDLGPPRKAILASPTRHVLTITDDDGGASASFTSASSTAAESGFVTLTVQLSRTQDVETVVPLVISTATAESTDFALTATEVRFPRSTVTAITPTRTVQVAIASDTLDESDETVVISLLPPQNGFAGPVASHTITITDDEDPPFVSFDAAALNSTNESGTITLNAILSAASDFDVTVPFTVQAASTASSSDYTLTPSPLTIPAGTLSSSITLTIVSDTSDEPDEKVVVAMGTPVNATRGLIPVSTLTIVDDDGLPTVFFETAVSSVQEGLSESVYVRLSSPSSSVVSVPITIDPSSTASPGDYRFDVTGVNFSQTSHPVHVFTLEDSSIEADETVALRLGTPRGASLGTLVTHALTVVDNDQPTVSVSIEPSGNAQSVIEAPAATFECTVALSAAAQQSVEILLSTVDGEAPRFPGDALVAVAGRDYLAETFAVSFAPGETMKTISTRILDDEVNETREVFQVVVLEATDNVRGLDRQEVYIVDDDLPPSLLTEDVRIVEGSSGTTTASVVVRLDAMTEDTLNIAANTLAGSARSPSDFTTASAQLTFGPGTTQRTLTVPIVADTIPESDDVFFIDFIYISGSIQRTARSTVTIVNDDPGPSLSVADASVHEHSGSNRDAEITVTLSAASQSPVTFEYEAVPGTAVQADYSLLRSSAVIAAGETTRILRVPIAGDLNIEPSETFLLRLSASTGATIADGEAVVTILDDDSIPPEITFSNWVVPEGNPTTQGTIGVGLSKPSSTPVTLSFETIDGTATAPSDYSATKATIVIGSGEVWEYLPIPIVADDDVEDDETFTVRLFDVAFATLPDDTIAVTIQNDDSEALPEITMSAARTVDEGSASSDTYATVTFELSKPAPAAGRPACAEFATSPGTAQEMVDFFPYSWSVCFGAGELTKTIDIEVYADDIVETNETFHVAFSGTLQDLTLGDQRSLTITIIDDDRITNPDAEADLAISLAPPSDPTLAAGEPAAYQLEVQNLGPGEATGIKLLIRHTVIETYAASYVESRIRTTAGRCSSSVQLQKYGPPDEVILCDLRPIQSGGIARIDLLTFVSRSGGNLTAIVWASQLDVNPHNNQLATELRTPNTSGVAGFGLDLTADRDPVAAGGIVTVTASITNGRRSDGGLLEIGIPEGADLVFYPSSHCQLTGDTLLCRFSIEPFVWVEFPIQLRLPDVGTINVPATLFGLEISDTETIHVVPAEDGPFADLALQYIDPPPQKVTPASGHPVTYELTVKNDGPAPANDVLLRIDRPTDMPPYEVPFRPSVLRTSAGICHSTLIPGPPHVRHGEDDGTRESIVCELGKIGPHDTVTISLEAFFNERNQPPMTLLAFATEPDPDFSDNNLEVDQREAPSSSRAPSIELTVDHNSIQAGGFATWRFRVGASEPVQTPIRIELPATAEVLSWPSADCLFRSPSIVCNKTWEPFSTQTFEIVTRLNDVGTATATAYAREELDPNREFVAATAQTKVAAPPSSADLDVRLLPPAADSFAKADPASYRFAVQNRGPAPALQTILHLRRPHDDFAASGKVTLPSFVRISQGSCTSRFVSGEKGRFEEIVCELGKLDPSALIDVELQTFVFDLTLGDITALVISGERDPDPADNQLRVPQYRPDTTRPPRVTLELEDDRDPVPLGAIVNYTARIAVGEGASRRLVIVVPSSQIVFWPAGQCELNAGILTCQTWEGVQYERLEIPILARLLDVGEIVAGAELHASSEPQQASETTTVTGDSSATDVAVEIVHSEPVLRDGSFAYYVQVSNQGNQPAYGVSVALGVPAAITPEDGYGSECPGGACHFGLVAAGETRQMTARYTIQPHFIGDQFTFTASASLSGIDTNPGNNAASQTTRIHCQSARAVSVSVPPGTLSGIEYTVSWTPNGAADDYDLDEATRSDWSDVSTTRVRGTSRKITKSRTVDTTYRYRVRPVARCNGQAGVSSAEALIVVTAPPPPPQVNQPPAVARVPIGTRAPVTLPMKIDSKIFGSQGQVSFNAATDKPWLTVSPSSGTTGGVTLGNQVELTITADPSTLAAGTSKATLLLTVTPASGPTSHATTTVSVPISISVVTPITTIERTFPPPPGTLVIPGVASATGMSSLWRSDLSLANTGNTPLQYAIAFIPSQADGTKSVKQMIVDLQPGQTMALEDIVGSWYSADAGSAGVTGLLELRPLSAVAQGLVAGSRTYNVTPFGTLGQFVPAVPIADFIGAPIFGGAASVLSLLQLRQTDLYRTNIGLVEGAGQPAQLIVRFFDASGRSLAQAPVSLGAGEHRQLNTMLASHGIHAADARAEIEVLSGGGKVTAYASVIDNGTGDPVLIPAANPQSDGAGRSVIPGMADYTSERNAWRSDVRLFNPAATTTRATVEFVPFGASQVMHSAGIDIAAGETRALDEIVFSTFGLRNAGGVLRISTSPAVPLVASARTYDKKSNGTLSQFIPAITAQNTAGFGESSLNVLNIEEWSGFRSNVGLVEMSGRSVRVAVTAHVPDSTATVELDLAPYESRQLGSILASLGLGTTYNGRVAFTVTGGSGRVAAYGSTIDNRTGDATYMPAQ